MLTRSMSFACRYIYGLLFLAPSIHRNLILMGDYSFSAQTIQSFWIMLQAEIFIFCR